MKSKLINKKIIAISLILAFVITMAQFIFAIKPVMAATIILPPGSTANNLQTAINNSAPGDIIVISSNITLNSNIGILVESEKDITIQSTAGNNWTIFQRQNSMFHFYISGDLTLQNITIDGGNTGGTVYVYGGNLILNDGAIVQNCVSPDVAAGLGIFRGTAIMNGNSVVRNCSAGIRGGGAYISQSTFTMNDESSITNCSVTSSTNSVGGGAYIYESTFNMNGNSTITECSSNVNGGGVYINDGTFNMNSGSITQNTANQGGGIYVYNGETIIGNATISENIVNGDGGGIYLTNEGNLEITGNTSINNNSASSGNGGGIYTENKRYENLITGSNTQFNNNISSLAETPPSGAQDLYPNIRFASTSIFNHPLNDYDINYATVYSIEYNANGGTGGNVIPDIVPGSIRTILSLEDVGIERPNYSFIKWNTEQDGSGTDYEPGDSITIDADIILYAQWETKGEHVVTFESNGGTVIDIRIVIDGETVNRPTDPTRAGYIFKGWYTDDGTFENEWNFDTSVTDNLTLYAKWEESPDSKPCDCRYMFMIIIPIIVIIFYEKICRIIKCIMRIH